MAKAARGGYDGKGTLVIKDIDGTGTVDALGPRRGLAA